MKGILEIKSLTEVKLVEICLHLKPTHIFFIIFKTGGRKLEQLVN